MVNFLNFFSLSESLFKRNTAIFFICFSLLYASTANSSDCSNGDIQFSNTISSPTSGDNVLHLNGVGARVKFIFDVYVAALYLPQPHSDPKHILSMPGEKQIQVHFLKEVSAEKLIEGWKDGFELNQTPQQLSALQERLQTSYRSFKDMKVGDVIHFNLIPNVGTQVSINGVATAVIEGDDFSQAVLKVWLGEHPPQKLLKQCLLGL